MRTGSEKVAGMCPTLIAKSDENWDLANQLRSDGKYDAAANRFYYSLFQAVKAYAIKTGKMKEEDNISVHSVAKGIIREDHEDYRLFGDAMEMRERGDYQSDHVAASEFPIDFVHKAELLRNHYRKLAVDKAEVAK